MMSKLDVKSLKKLIKEMIEQKINEEEIDECGMPEESHEPNDVEQEGDLPSEVSSIEVDPDGYEGYMAKSNLYKMAKSATDLHNMLKDEENLEPWVEEKIAVAANMIDTVADYMEYAKMAKK